MEETQGPFTFSKTLSPQDAGDSGCPSIAQGVGPSLPWRGASPTIPLGAVVSGRRDGRTSDPPQDV